MTSLDSVVKFDQNHAKFDYQVILTQFLYFLTKYDFNLVSLFD